MQSRVRVMVFITTFNNILAISWQSVLLLEETQVPGKNHRPVAGNWHYISPGPGFELTTLVVITDCTGSCKSNYHTTTLQYTINQETKPRHLFIYLNLLFRWKRPVLWNESCIIVNNASNMIKKIHIIRTVHIYKNAIIMLSQEILGQPVSYLVSESWSGQIIIRVLQCQLTVNPI